MRKLAIGFILLFVIALVVLINNYNTIQKNDELVVAAASELLNQYQRRSDLVPNLVNTVKGYSNHESNVLREVVQARASVGQINVSADIFSDPEIAAAYQKAQNSLGQSLSRLLIVAENYPELKASSLYQDLMVQLEGAENRISVARTRYIDAVRHYNTQIRQFPYSVIAKYFDYEAKANFSVENEQQIKTAPIVDFSS